MSELMMVVAVVGTLFFGLLVVGVNYSSKAVQSRGMLGVMALGLAWSSLALLWWDMRSMDKQAGSLALSAVCYGLLWLVGLWAFYRSAGSRRRAGLYQAGLGLVAAAPLVIWPTYMRCQFLASVFDWLPVTTLILQSVTLDVFWLIIWTEFAVLADMGMRYRALAGQRADFCRER